MPTHRTQPLRYSAFTSPSGGGNPAGVLLDASALDDTAMLRVAAALGYSESAFVTSHDGRSFGIRYFTPEAEIDFCGHATVATAVALAEREGAGDFVFRTRAGDIPVSVAVSSGELVATLTSVVPRTTELEDRDRLLELLRWSSDDLDPDLPDGLAFAGVWHPILWAATRERLADLDYDFAGLRALMRERGWATVSLLHRESETLVHARNPFAGSGVVEDPATGAAAAAVGGFLREHGLLPPDARFTIRQGDDMERPSVLEVDAGGDAGIRVTGAAHEIGSPASAVPPAG